MLFALIYTDLPLQLAKRSLVLISSLLFDKYIFLVIVEATHNTQIDGQIERMN